MRTWPRNTRNKRSRTCLRRSKRAERKNHRASERQPERRPCFDWRSDHTISGQREQLRRFLIADRAARARSDSFKPISQGGLEDE